MREENTEEVIPAKHVTDAALTFKKKKNQLRYYTCVRMCPCVCKEKPKSQFLVLLRQQQNS